MTLVFFLFICLSIGGTLSVLGSMARDNDLDRRVSDLEKQRDKDKAK